MFSARLSSDASQLAELKVVSGGYPFYGQLKLNPSRPLQELLTSDSVVVAPELMSRLILKLGDELRVGGVPFRVAGSVLEEPDKLSITFICPVCQLVVCTRVHYVAEPLTALLTLTAWHEDIANLGFRP